jgi:hypothetical protein
MRCCFSGERNPSVRMLCRRSASFTTTTRTSFTIASSILRTFSAWRASGASRSSRLIFVTPSTRRAMSGPKRSTIRAEGIRVSSTTSCSNAAHSVVMSSFMSAEDVCDFEGMREVGIAGLAQLRAVLLGGKFERAAKQLDVAGRARLPDLLDQFEEARLQRARCALRSASHERRQPCRLFERRHFPVFYVYLMPSARKEFHTCPTRAWFED